jgi:preprotein translocase subunit SecG
MGAVVIIFHVLVAFLLVVAVLLQAGKGGGLAGSIGGGMGGGSGSVLGGRTASTFLTKATSVLATTFLLSCLWQSITFDTSSGPSSAVERRLDEGVSEFMPFMQSGGEAPSALGEMTAPAGTDGGTGEPAATAE